ncbi:serine protease FAM111A [Haplochromis burtoni]|uniref:serine protease FAM111A n=1 Tax=Haplochromis burtoni TaxID=8153 RepID=UPI001C2D0DD5|nr:serine protease FAM111A [Haplochromis burtoni]
MPRKDRRKPCEAKGRGPLSSWLKEKSTVSDQHSPALQHHQQQRQQKPLNSNIVPHQDSSGGSRGRVKWEPEEATVSQDPHKHEFTVEFGSEKYNIDCERPCTVLEAIKSKTVYKKTVKCADEYVIIRRGTGDNESIVPTHFPCSCISDGELLSISSINNKQVGETKDVRDIHPKDSYSVFYIDTMGGKNLKPSKHLKFTILNKFKYLCVYGEKEITVEEALKRDGRFTDDIGSFDLINITDECKTECTDKIDRLDEKKFQIHRLQKGNAETTTDVNQVALAGQQKLQNPPHASNNAERTRETRSVLAVAQQKVISIKTAAKETNSSIDPKEVYKLLRKQFPRLKQWMESRFPGNSFQEALKLRKENFGKIQQSFSEIHRVRKLLELSQSVCFITGTFIMQGTGFVLFDNYVLTNAHLFKYYTHKKSPNWQEIENITVVFNFETQEFKEMNKINAKVFVGNAELDYVILKLETEEVPPGLLERFGPVPPDGEACVVGHPGQGVKKMDPTCVIEKEGREEAVNKNLEDIKEYFITICAINQAIKNDPCENIYVTYNSFMYHGSSGSPVFDAHGQVFGLHSGGFFYGFPKAKQSVIEFSFPLLTIFKHFVDNLKKKGYGKVLERVEEVAKGNPYLENIIASVVGSKQDMPEASSQCSDKMECD